MNFYPIIIWSRSYTVGAILLVIGTRFESGYGMSQRPTQLWLRLFDLRKLASRVDKMVKTH